MAMEQPEYAKLTAQGVPDGDKGHRHIKEIAFVDDNGNPVEIATGSALADGSVTPAKLASYDAGTAHGKVVKVKSDGSGFDFADDATAPAAASLTPAQLKGYVATTDKGSIIKVSADGASFDPTMPSAVGNAVLVANTTAAARTAIGVPTDTVTTEALAALKGKAEIKALTVLATNADAATVLAKVNQIIAALQA